jgi:hypothetical protein
MAFVQNGTYSISNGALDKFTLIMYKERDDESCLENVITPGSSSANTDVSFDVSEPDYVHEIEFIYNPV